jgi:hypothetical protein
MKKFFFKIFNFLNREKEIDIQDSSPDILDFDLKELKSLKFSIKEEVENDGINFEEIVHSFIEDYEEDRDMNFNE